MPWVHTIRPCLCVKKGRRSSRPRGRAPTERRPLSVKYHQSQPRRDDLGPNGIDCPSLTGILQAHDREKEMSRRLEARERGGRRDAAPRELRIPERLAGRRGSANPPRSGGRGQRGQPWKGRPPPRPLGREGPRSAGQGCGRAFSPKPVQRPPPPRPAAASWPPGAGQPAAPPPPPGGWGRTRRRSGRCRASPARGKG